MWTSALPTFLASVSLVTASIRDYSTISSFCFPEEAKFFVAAKRRVWKPQSIQLRRIHCQTMPKIAYLSTTPTMALQMCGILSKDGRFASCSEPRAVTALMSNPQGSFIWT